MGFPGGTSGKEPTCQCRRHKSHGFNPWVRKIPWRRAWQSTPVFLPVESHGQRGLGGLCFTASQRVGQDWSDLAYTHAYSNMTGVLIRRGDTVRQQTGAEGRPWEILERSWPPTSHRERPQRKPFQNLHRRLLALKTKRKFILLLKPLSLWYFVLAAPTN